MQVSIREFNAALSLINMGKHTVLGTSVKKIRFYINSMLIRKEQFVVFPDDSCFGKGVKRLAAEYEGMLKNSKVFGK